jgi:signal transduction histidine kinase
MRTRVQNAKTAMNKAVPKLLKNWFRILPGKFNWLFYAGCATSVMLVLSLGIASYITLNNEQRTQKLVGHSYMVIRKVDSIELLINIIAFLRKGTIPDVGGALSQQYNLDTSQLFRQLITLTQLAKNNQVKQQTSKLTSQLKAGLKRQAIAPLIKANMMSGSPLDAINPKVKQSIDGIRETENALLRKREQGYAASLTLQKIIGVVGTTLVLTIVAFLIYMIVKELRNRYDAYQREHELSMLKSSFVTLASHEFRTPLSAILLSSSLIEKYAEKESNPGIIKHALKIKGIVNNLKTILEDFLSLEKLDNGKVIPHFKAFDLPDLCQEIIDQLKEGNPERELNYEHMGEGHEALLDENLIRNAIINLLTNALKYAGHDARISLISEVTNERIRISIKDNGVGVPQKYQDKLFTLFFRVDESGCIPGTGLGLNIVMRYVQLMKGAISFTSEPYHETCFEMSFPVNEQ